MRDISPWHIQSWRSLRRHCSVLVSDESAGIEGKGLSRDMRYGELRRGS